MNTSIAVVAPLLLLAGIIGYLLGRFGLANTGREMREQRLALALEEYDAGIPDRYGMLSAGDVLKAVYPGYKRPRLGESWFDRQGGE